MLKKKHVEHELITFAYEMGRLIKTGLIGLAITIVISLLLYFTASVSFRALAPFYMPWTVLLLIGLTNKKKKQSK